MSSEGSREIEGARKRLAAANSQAIAASTNLETIKQLLAHAQSMSDAAEKEKKEALTALNEAERRWEVIDIDADGTNNASMDDIGSNEQRKVPALTPNAIPKMYSMSCSAEDTSFTPILQVIHVKKISKEGDEERFKVVLSDGQYFFSSMTSSQITHLVHNGIISQHCILRITEFVINMMGGGAKICIILGAEKVGDNLGSWIGAPVDISKVPVERIVVEGCGIPELNDTYTKVLVYQNAPVYVKKGLWKGKEVKLAIFMPSATHYNWQIGIWREDGEGPSSLFYSSTYNSRDEVPPSTLTPPEIGWDVVGNGINPAPICRYMRGHDRLQH